MVYIFTKECPHSAYRYAFMCPRAVIDNESIETDRLFGGFGGTCNGVSSIDG